MITPRRADRQHLPQRSLATLVSDFGGRLPIKTSEPVVNRRNADRDLFRGLLPRRGRPERGYGWAPVPAPLVTYRATTADIGGVFPMLSANGLAPTGALVGWDALSGGAFFCDPVGWVLNKVVTNPNIITFGKPGMGKTTTIMLILLRLMRFGVKTFVAGDVKGEYEDLCRAVGVEPFALGVGMPTRINALDLGPMGQGWDRLDREELKIRSMLVFGRWQVLLKALIGAKGVQVTASDEDVLTVVLEELTGWRRGTTHLTPIIIPQVWMALREPSPELITECRYPDRQAFLDGTRHITDAHGGMCRGSLAGLFDAHTNITVDWNAPIQSLSLQRLASLGDEATGVALACLNSWSRAMTDLRAPGDIRLIVRDEVWRQMRLGLGAVESLDADLRLSRFEGAVQWVIGHKPSDMLSVGDAGSRAVTIAKDMIALCDTKVLLGQDPKIADELDELLQLGEVQRDWVTGWARQEVGRALWVVGDRAFKVKAVQSATEKALMNTNSGLERAI